MSNLRTIRKIRSLIILGLDLISSITIFSSVFYFRLERLPNYRSLDLWIIIGTLIVTLYLFGTYFKERSNKYPALPIRTFFVTMAGGAVCMLWVYLLGPSEFNQYFGRGILPVGTVLFGIAATLTRYSVNSVYHYQERGVELLYLGYSQSCEAFIKELKNHSEVRSVTIVSHTSHRASWPDNICVTNSGLEGALEASNSKVIVVDPEHRTSEEEKSLLIKQRLSGTPVLSLSDYYEINWFMIPVNHIGDDWFLRSQGFSMLGDPISNRIKRSLDIGLAILLLIVTAPIMLISAILIKLTSTGQVIFKQQRVGYLGKTFTIYKLRTMHSNAESDGAQWAQKSDPRITPVGSFLRKSRIDELPQCINVIAGEMSFVGPRPERPEFTKKLRAVIPYYELRHTVKPGLSGWAQVIVPYGASTEDALKKLEYELYYIKNQSLLLDLNVMIRTLFTVFQRMGR